MSAALTERVLDVWERGAGLDLNARANLALELVDHPGDGGQGRETATLYERDHELVALRRTLFGSSLEGVVQCPACRTDFEMGLDLSLLSSPAPTSEPVRIEMDGFVALVRPPRGDDLIGLQRELSADALAEHLFARCVVEATRGSERIGALDLPGAVRAAAAAEMSARGMEGPSVDLVCGECAQAWRAPLDITRALLGEMDSWVTRLLDDVQRIAAAYHWSERDIMALPIRRRLYYLEAIG